MLFFPPSGAWEPLSANQQQGVLKLTGHSGACFDIRVFRTEDPSRERSWGMKPKASSLAFLPNEQVTPIPWLRNPW